MSVLFLASLLLLASMLLLPSLLLLACQLVIACLLMLAFLLLLASLSHCCWALCCCWLSWYLRFCCYLYPPCCWCSCCFLAVDGALLLMASLSILASLCYSSWYQPLCTVLYCTMRHIRLSDYRTAAIGLSFFVCQRTIRISHIGLGNSRNYRTIGCYHYGFLCLIVDP